jgi:hypothetical protein
LLRELAEGSLVADGAAKQCGLTSQFRQGALHIEFVAGRALMVFLANREARPQLLTACIVVCLAFILVDACVSRGPAAFLAGAARLAGLCARLQNGRLCQDAHGQGHDHQYKLAKHDVISPLSSA